MIVKENITVLPLNLDLCFLVIQEGHRASSAVDVLRWTLSRTLISVGSHPNFKNVVKQIVPKLRQSGLFYYSVKPGLYS